MEIGRCCWQIVSRGTGITFHLHLSFDELKRCKQCSANAGVILSLIFPFLFFSLQPICFSFLLSEWLMEYPFKALRMSVCELKDALHYNCMFSRDIILLIFIRVWLSVPYETKPQYQNYQSSHHQYTFSVFTMKKCQLVSQDIQYFLVDNL